MSVRNLFFISSLFLLTACDQSVTQVTPGQQTPRATILYTTDTHGRLISDSNTIGIEIIAGLRKTTANALLVDAGDHLQGAPIANLTEGKDVIALMKLAGYDAIAVGNHEFDHGKAAFLARRHEAQISPNVIAVLAANIISTDGSPIATPATIKTIGGLKIGLFGLTTESTTVQTHPKNIEGLKFQDVIVTAKRQVADLRRKGCDVVIALTHVGTEGLFGAKSTDIARQVEGIDIIIDGHSHTVVDKTEKNGVRIVSSGAYAENIGRIIIAKTDLNRLEIKNQLMRKQDLSQIKPDETTLQRLKAVQAEHATILDRVVSKTAVDIIGDRALVRTQETNFGDLCADAIRHLSKADFAIVNGGMIRQSIKKGVITQGDILSALPFGGGVVTKTITGKQLLEILEFGFHATPREFGGFPQISGLKVVLNRDKPAGYRIVSITRSDGNPIHMTGTYSLAVSDFMARGGDGYTLLAKIPTTREFSSPDVALAHYLKVNGTVLHPDKAALRIIYRDDAASKRSAASQTLKPAA